MYGIVVMGHVWVYSVVGRIHYHYTSRLCLRCGVCMHTVWQLGGFSDIVAAVAYVSSLALRQLPLFMSCLGWWVPICGGCCYGVVPVWCVAPFVAGAA